MEEILEEIKKLILNNENEKAITYIDELLTKNQTAEKYLDELVNDLK